MEWVYLWLSAGAPHDRAGTFGFGQSEREVEESEEEEKELHGSLR